MTYQTNLKLILITKKILQKQNFDKCYKIFDFSLIHYFK